MSVINPKAIVQKIALHKNDLKLKTPFSMSISGASQSGKSELIVQLIKYKDLIFDSDFTRIIYCQPEGLAHRPNRIFDKLKEDYPLVELVSGLPDFSKLYLDLDSKPSLLIVDDQMNDFLNSAEMIKLLTVDVHHHNISIIFTLQNYFCSSKYGKTLMRNVNIKVFFYNRLDQTELRTISSQIVPKNSNFLDSCFKYLLEKFPNDPSQYVLVDGHYRSSAPHLFVRSRIFPDTDGEIRPIIFFPK